MTDKTNKKVEILWEYPKENNIVYHTIIISNFEASDRLADLLEDELGYLDKGFPVEDEDK